MSSYQLHLHFFLTVRFAFFLTSGLLAEGYKHWFGVQSEDTWLYILYEAGYLVFFVAFAGNLYPLFAHYSDMVEDEIDLCSCLTGISFGILIILEGIAQIVCWILQGTLSENSVEISNIVFDAWHIFLFILCIVHLLNFCIRIRCEGYSSEATSYSNASAFSLLFFVFFIAYAVLDILKFNLGDYFIWFTAAEFVCEAVPAFALYNNLFDGHYLFNLCRYKLLHPRTWEQINYER